MGSYRGISAIAVVSALALTGCGGSGGNSGSGSSGGANGSSGSGSTGTGGATGSSGASSGATGCGSGGAGSDAGTLPAPYAGICTKYGLTCTTANTPPTLVGTYTGTGATVHTGSPTWTVGAMETFTTTIASQTCGKIVGTFSLGDISFNVTDGNINGSGNSFTIYGTGSAMSNGCTVTAAVVIVGTEALDSVTGNTGLLVLSTSGSGCPADDGGTDGGTEGGTSDGGTDGGTRTPAANEGALFNFAATRAPDGGSDGGADASADSASGASSDGGSEGG